MMSGILATTIEGGETTLKEVQVRKLASRFRGQLLHRGDDGYDGARPTGVADVVDAVKFARTNNLPVSVRGGGHNVAGNAVSDGGLMIDLSLMKGIQVDPKARTARAGPGATLEDLDRETQAFGLAIPAGIVSTPALRGLRSEAALAGLRESTVSLATICCRSI